MFQDWSEEKLNKYDINPKIYDHTNVQDCPSILMDNYAKKRKYITIIFLWDEKKDLILASKYDPLKIGIGEAGTTRQGADAICALKDHETRSPRMKKKKTPEEEAQVMMKTVVDLFYEKEEAISVSTMSDSFGKEETLSDLVKQHDMYMNNLKFHKENGTLTPK